MAHTAEVRAGRPLNRTPHPRTRRKRQDILRPSAERKDQEKPPGRRPRSRVRARAATVGGGTVFRVRPRPTPPRRRDRRGIRRVVFGHRAVDRVDDELVGGRLEDIDDGAGVPRCGALPVADLGADLQRRDEPRVVLKRLHDPASVSRPSTDQRRRNALRVLTSRILRSRLNNRATKTSRPVSPLLSRSERQPHTPGTARPRGQSARPSTRRRSTAPGHSWGVGSLQVRLGEAVPVHPVFQVGFRHVRGEVKGSVEGE